MDKDKDLVWADEYLNKRPEEISEYHNSNDYDNKFSLNNITHKEIAKNIKIISKKNMYGWIIILIILGILAIINSFYLIFVEEEPGAGFLFFIVCLISIIVIFYSCFLIFLTLTGYAALIEDVNQIKNSLVKKDNEIEDLPRL